MPGAAAIFDLDRTLLKGSSTPAFNDALFEAGILGRRGFPGQGLMVKAYEVGGETLPSMALARLASAAAAGHPVDEVGKAAEAAADMLVRDVLPWSLPLIENHRQAGRRLVLATTSPYDLVKPLADRLGFDDVIATRWSVRPGRDGVRRYSGGIDGPFVWGLGKLGAVRRWAATEGIELGQSWAYSDSIYDAPLLLAVGHPTAVNPDVRLLGLAILRRWPITNLDAPPSVPKILGAEMQDLIRTFTPKAAFPYARFDISGTHHIPRRGPVIVAANHRSYFDPIAFALAIYESGRSPRVLAKKELFDAPIVGTVLRTMGTICVDRKGDDPAAALNQAELALQGGECVVILPQGTIPQGDAFFDGTLSGKTGVARLAATTGAPVVPLGLWGSEAVWPRSALIPNVTAVLRPPTVRVRVGAPVRGLTGTDPTADTETIMQAIASQLPPEAQLSRIPSDDERAASMAPRHRTRASGPTQSVHKVATPRRPTGPTDHG
jgi:putative phosphoserine phosphatase / 1-acylglycerol-3-phosphate O-acyltransferase